MRPKPMMKEQRCEEIAGAVDRNRQVRRAQSPETGFVSGQNVESAGGRVVELQGRRRDDPRSPCAQRGDRPPRRRQIAQRFAGEPFELERVWRGDGREREGAVTEEFTDAG